MKLFADYKIEKGYKRISIWNIYNGYKAYISLNEKIELKEYYKKFYKNRIFSTHRNRKIPMTLVVRHPYGKSFFKYLRNKNPKGELESVSHSTYKEIVNEMRILNLVVHKQKIKLYVSYSDIEYYFNANGNDYYADIFIYFNKSEPEEYYYKWGGKLCFEIKHTHPVEKKKAYDCYKEGIAIFEHPISEKLMINGNTNSEEELINQKNFIAKELSEEIYGDLISNPSTEEYVMIQKLKSENIALKTENESLRKYNTNLIKKINELNDSIEKSNNDVLQLQNEHFKFLQLKRQINNHKFLRKFMKLFKDLKDLV